MTQWLSRTWTLPAIALIGLGVGVFQAIYFSDVPDALPRLFTASAILAIAFGSVLTIAACTDRQHRRQVAKTRRFHDIAGAAGDWLWETGPDLRFT